MFEFVPLIGQKKFFWPISEESPDLKSLGKVKAHQHCKEVVQTQRQENTPDDVTPLKTFMTFSVILVGENYKESIDSCPITKVSNNSHLSLLFFRSLFSRPI